MTAPGASAKPTRGAGTLVRGIRRWDLVAMVLNTVIGAGIFGLPSLVHAAAGSYSILAYVVVVLLIALIVMCFAEVASRYGETGGPYTYAMKTFGPMLGFEMGWLLWLARITAFAALCNLFVDYFALFIPAVEAGMPRIVLITTFTAVVTWVNIVGVRKAALVGDAFTIAKLLPLLLFVVVGAFFIDFGNFAAPVPSTGDFADALVFLVFAFSGFEMAVIPAGETASPQKHIPFALFTGVGTIALLYVLIQVVSVGTLPGIADSTRPLADAALNFAGPIGAGVITLGALISISGTLNANILAGPRLLFAMSEQQQLPPVFSRLHPVFHTPWAAILATSGISLVLTIQGSFIQALTVSTIIRLLTYAVTCAALPVLRRRNDAPAALFRVPAGNIVAGGALLLTALLLAGRSFAEARLTFILVVVGMVLYFPLVHWRKGR